MKHFLNFVKIKLIWYRYTVYFWIIKGFSLHKHIAQITIHHFALLMEHFIFNFFLARTTFPVRFSLPSNRVNFSSVKSSDDKGVFLKNLKDVPEHQSSSVDSKLVTVMEFPELLVRSPHASMIRHRVCPLYSSRTSFIINIPRGQGRKICAVAASCMWIQLGV